MGDPTPTDHETVEPRDLYREVRRWGQIAAVLAGLLCGIVAALTILWRRHLLFGPTDYGTALVSTCATVAVLMPLLWTRLAARDGAFRIWSGAFAGMLALLLAHFLAPLVGAALSLLVDADRRPSLLWLLQNPLSLLVSGLLNLMSAWWITLPLGAAGGLAVSTLSRDRLRGVGPSAEPGQATDERSTGRAVSPEVYRRIRSWGRRAFAVAALVGSGSLYAMFAVTVLRPEDVYDAFGITLLLGVVLGPVLAGPAIWSRMAADGRTFRFGLGLLAGALTALVGHLSMALAIGALGMATVASDIPDGPFLRAADVATAILATSLLLGGWITVSVGALGGWIVTALCRRRLRRAGAG